MKTNQLAITLLLAAASASAQTIHVKIGSDGHKSFTDIAGATPDRETAPAVEEPRAPAGTMAKGSRRAAVVDATEAHRRLGQAQRSRKQGAQPLPSELATAYGAGVVHHSYWRRQEKLRLAVEQAQRRSNETGTLLIAQR